MDRSSSWLCEIGEVVYSSVRSEKDGGWHVSIAERQGSSFHECLRFHTISL